MGVWLLGMAIDGTQRRCLLVMEASSLTGRGWGSKSQTKTPPRMIFHHLITMVASASQEFRMS